MTLRISLIDQCFSAEDPQKKLHFHVVYLDSVLKQPTVLQWYLNLRYGENSNLKIYQIPVISGWLIYVTLLMTPSFTVVGNTSEAHLCQVRINISNKADVQSAAENDIVTLDSPSLESFASYHFIWTQQEYTWYEAEDMCVKLGMHLASLTSETEYHVVQNLLSGDGYRLNDTKDGHGLLTPCRLETALCMIFIGLQYKVSEYAK